MIAMEISLIDSDFEQAPCPAGMLTRVSLAATVSVFERPSSRPHSTVLGEALSATKELKQELM
jgi:hypothetical protein